MTVAENTYFSNVFVSQYNNFDVVSYADVFEGRRSYENIFVAGGALIADDSILKTVEPGNGQLLFLSLLIVILRECHTFFLSASL